MRKGNKLARLICSWFFVISGEGKNGSCIVFALEPEDAKVVENDGELDLSEFEAVEIVESLIVGNFLVCEEQDDAYHIAVKVIGILPTFTEAESSVGT